MITLDSTLKSLEVKTDGFTTTESSVVAAWADITTTTFTPGETDTITTNTTAVTAVAAPAASTQRQVKYLSVNNADSVARVVTVQLNNNGTKRITLIATLQVGDTITYANGVWTQTSKAGLITANFVYAGPSSGAAGPATFRALVAADIPTIDLATKVTGILPAADFPALTGDVTTSSGSLATTIGAGKVTTAKCDTTNDGGVVNQWDNLFDNPQGRVAQRSNGTIATTGVYLYGACDRWKCAATCAVSVAGTISQDTAAPVGNSGYGVKVNFTGGSTNGVVYCLQAIESKNAVKLRNRNASFSFNVRHDWGANVNFQISVYRCSAAADTWGANFANITLIGSGNVTSVPTATSTQIVLTNQAMGETNTGLLVQITATLVSAATVTNKNVWFTDMQAQLGPTVTPCEERPFQVELARCQRYFVAFGGTTTNEIIGMAQCFTTTTAGATVLFPVEMRTTPGMSFTAAGNYRMYTASGAGQQCTVMSANALLIGKKACNINITVAANLVAGNSSLFGKDSTPSDTLQFDADF